MRPSICLVTILFSYVPLVALADVFHMPGDQKSLDFVTVGDPGNEPDPYYYYAQGGSIVIGNVPYTYQIGKYDVTSAQYAQFLNAVAASDPYTLFSDNRPASQWSSFGIVRSGTSGSYTYSVPAGWENYPVNYVSFADAARFCNWLQNGQPTGAEGPDTTETGAYTLNGAMSTSAFASITRNTDAKYALPTASEWYKAALYKGGGTNAGYWFYDIGSDYLPSNVLDGTGTHNANYNAGTAQDPILTDPVYGLTPVGAFAGTPGPYGTYDMAGNVAQWTEEWASDGTWRKLYGGSFLTTGNGMYTGYNGRGYATGQGGAAGGFRVVGVPEPSALALLGVASLPILLLFRRRLPQGVS